MIEPFYRTKSGSNNVLRWNSLFNRKKSSTKQNQGFFEAITVKVNSHTKIFSNNRVIN